MELLHVRTAAVVIDVGESLHFAVLADNHDGGLALVYAAMIQST